MHTTASTSPERNQRFVGSGSERLRRGVFTVANTKEGEKMEIRKCRKKQGLTQVELAKKMGVAPSTIAQWETGARNPNIRQAPILAKVLECTLDDLFGKE